MSAIGIDFGNENCYVAVPRAGGIEIVTNDYSQRATPSYVAFGPTNRDLGTSAKNKFITNLKNTVCNFKRIIGHKYGDSVIQNQMSYLPNPVFSFQNGNAGFVVEYLGKEAKFTTNQIAAMLLTKLKNITETAYRSKVVDCVIATIEHVSFSSAKLFIDRFPILLLNTELNEELDILQTEFCELQSTVLTKTLDEPRADVKWHLVGNLKNEFEQKMFSNISQFMLTILTIPRSNGESEWVFSHITKIIN